MKIQMVLGLAAALLTTPAAFGDITIGSLNDAGYNSSSGHTYLGQSFTVPAGETGLVAGSLALHGSGGSDSSGFWRLYTFSDDGGSATLGTQLASASITVAGANAPVTYSHNFNVPVVAGDKYALLVDWGSPNNAGGYFSNSSYYPGGTTIFSTDGGVPVVYNNYDMAFQITFGQIPEPALLGVLAPLMLLVRRRRSSV